MGELSHTKIVGGGRGQNTVIFHVRILREAVVPCVSGTIPFMGCARSHNTNSYRSAIRRAPVAPFSSRIDFALACIHSLPICKLLFGRVASLLSASKSRPGHSFSGLSPAMKRVAVNHPRYTNSWKLERIGSPRQTAVSGRKGWAPRSEAGAYFFVPASKAWPVKKTCG